jgi:hypothetical protein
MQVRLKVNQKFGRLNISTLLSNVLQVILEKDCVDTSPDDDNNDKIDLNALLFYWNNLFIETILSHFVVANIHSLVNSIFILMSSTVIWTLLWLHVSFHNKFL